MKMKVLGNKVNLRAKPNKNAEVVTQVSSNAQLLAKSVGPEWVEIVPPAMVELWVLGEYIKDGVINSQQKVNVRAGPGINFSIVGKLSQGDKVVVKGSHQEWVSIVPPPSCSVWIDRTYVDFAADETPTPPVKVETSAAPSAKPVMVRAESATPVAPGKAAAKTEAAPTPAMVVTQIAGMATTLAKTEPAPGQPALTGPPSDLELIDSPVQGQRRQYEGVLQLRGYFFRTPSKYRLMTYDPEQSAVMICFVKGNNAQLEALLGRRMIVSGREYWVKNQRYPVLVLDRTDRIILK